MNKKIVKEASKAGCRDHPSTAGKEACMEGSAARQARQQPLQTAVPTPRPLSPQAPLLPPGPEVTWQEPPSSHSWNEEGTALPPFLSRQFPRVSWCF